MRLLSQTEFEDLAPGYVLGILEPDELTQVETYLTAHPEGWDRVQALERVVDQLGYAVPDAPPLDPQVKGRVLAAIQADREPRQTTSRSTPLPPTTPSVWDMLRSLLGRGWSVGLAVVSLVLLVGLGLRLNAVQSSLADLQGEVVELTTRLSQSEASVALRDADIARLTNSLAQAQRDNQQLVAALQQQRDLLSRATTLVRLDPGQGAPTSATARVYLTADNRALVITEGLPALRQGRVYVLWGIQSSGPLPLGAYQVDAQGQGVWLVQSSVPLTSLAGFGVTEESTPDARTPTLPILLAGQRTS